MPTPYIICHAIAYNEDKISRNIYPTGSVAAIQPLRIMSACSNTLAHIWLRVRCWFILLLDCGAFWYNIYTLHMSWSCVIHIIPKFIAHTHCCSVVDDDTDAEFVAVAVVAAGCSHYIAKVNVTQLLHHQHHHQHLRLVGSPTKYQNTRYQNHRAQAKLLGVHNNRLYSSNWKRKKKKERLYLGNKIKLIWSVCLLLRFIILHLFEFRLVLSFHFARKEDRITLEMYNNIITLCYKIMRAVINWKISLCLDWRKNLHA